MSVYNSLEYGDYYPYIYIYIYIYIYHHCTRDNPIYHHCTRDNPVYPDGANPLVDSDNSTSFKLSIRIT